MKMNHFGNIVRYIYNHIDQPLPLESIAEHVNLSVSSLKRLIEEITDQSSGKFIRRLKLELAFRSLQSRNNSVLDIALSSGFDNHAAFSRCFKTAFGYAPRNARKKLNILSELECIDLVDPEIIELTGFTCQSITKVGTYFEAAPQAFQVLKQALTPEELSDDFSGFFIGIGHDNPHEEQVAVNQCRFTAGVVTYRALGLEITNIAAGYYARFYYYGKPASMGLAYHYIYGKWAETSGHVINRKQPAFQAFERWPSGFRQERILINVPLK